MELLDYLIKNHGFKNDRAIALHMGIGISTLSKIRNKKIVPSAEIILRVHETFGIDIKKIRQLCVGE
jgi:transcriptional regulator with XRE-family HTH domain